MTQDDPHGKPSVVALTFEHDVQEIWADGQSVTITVELSNGRKLVLDDYGVVDHRDLGLDEDDPKPLPEALISQHYGYLSWTELLEALDRERARSMN